MQKNKFALTLAELNELLSAEKQINGSNSTKDDANDSTTSASADGPSIIGERQWRFIEKTVSEHKAGLISGKKFLVV